MILIADSGSTKSAWALIEKGNLTTTIMTPGLNPYFTAQETIMEIIGTELVPQVPVGRIHKIFFYGAGCSTEKNNGMISSVLQKFFPNAWIEIHHDILGAARALFGNSEGLACILGTGCNSCYTNGTSLESRVPSLGYLFGDEGAGSYLGKHLLGDYLHDRLPAEIRDEFRLQFNFTLEEILNALYNKPFPNRFLASLSLFLHPRKDHPYVHDLVMKSFRDFIREHITRYPRHKDIPVGFIGSIAWFYEDILKLACQEAGIHLFKVLPSPLEGLIAFHSS